MELVLRVIASTALVLGLIRLLAWALNKYGPGILGMGTSGTGQERRMRLIETLALPGGVVLYLVSVQGRPMMLVSSRWGLKVLDVEPSDV